MGLPTIYEYGKEENQFVRVVLIKTFFKNNKERKRIYIYVTHVDICHKNFTSRNNTPPDVYIISLISHYVMYAVCTGYVIVYDKAS